jgi:hypothetical protein
MHNERINVIFRWNKFYDDTKTLIVSKNVAKTTIIMSLFNNNVCLDYLTKYKNLLFQPVLCLNTEINKNGTW